VNPRIDDLALRTDTLKYWTETARSAIRGSRPPSASPAEMGPAAHRHPFQTEARSLGRRQRLATGLRMTRPVLEGNVGMQPFGKSVDPGRVRTSRDATPAISQGRSSFVGRPPAVGQLIQRRLGCHATGQNHCGPLYRHGTAPIGPREPWLRAHRREPGRDGSERRRGAAEVRHSGASPGMPRSSSCALLVPFVIRK
jgi:hypothetical protein